MALEWSHTPEAYQNVEKEIREKDREWLETVYAEWHAQYEDDLNGFDQWEYQRAKEKAKALTEEDLADFIWERTEELRTCDNGGYDAHCCPYGCNIHKVSFS